MPKAKAHADISLCKGCHLCIEACPTEAIKPSNTVNKQGYEVITIDEEACIGCGQCYTICPDYVFTIE